MIKVALSKERIHSGELILVNRDYQYIESMDIKTLDPINSASTGEVLMERQAAASFGKLMESIYAQKQITAVSGWRSLKEQEQIYSSSLIENGMDFTSKYVQLPGHSEHQTGLAIDLALVQPNIDFLRPHFPRTGICGEFRSVAGLFGFIERYPKDKEDITGIAYEPWHFRYIGTPHATIMETTGDTLEEYHARLKRYPYGSKPFKSSFRGSVVDIFYLASDKEITVFEIEDNRQYSISGNNMDGFIITMRNA